MTSLPLGAILAGGQNRRYGAHKALEVVGGEAIIARVRRALLTVTAPLLRPALAATFVFAFVQAVGTLSTVIFLVSFDTPLASVTILNLAEQGSWGRAAALASALVLVTVAALALLYLVAGRSVRLWGFSRAGG